MRLKVLLIIFHLLFCSFAFSVEGLSESSDFQLKYFDLTEGRLAFTLMYGSNRDIYVLDFSDLSFLPVANSSAVEEAPSWSPDGRKIAFHADSSGDREIFIINDDGTGLTQLTRSPGPDENPSWSPDGKTVIFQSSRLGPLSQIFIMNADGTRQIPLFPTTKETNNKNVTPRISPRDSEVLYVTNKDWPGWDISLYDTVTKKHQVLTKGFISYIRPSWNIDGSAFAFSYGSGDDSDIWYLQKGDTSPKIFVRREGRDVDPCWNEKGNLIFFAGEAISETENFQLFLYDNTPLNSGELKPEERTSLLLANKKGSLRHPSWTPLPSLNLLVQDLRNARK